MIDTVRPPPTVLLLGAADGIPSRGLPLASLHASGYRIVDHRGVQDGLMIARALAPDVVLMDVVSGDAATLEMCRVLQGDHETQKIPLIAITGDEASSFGRFMITLRVARCDPTTLLAEVTRAIAVQ